MKTQKFLKIGFPIFLVIFAIFAIIQMPLLGIFALGGVIQQGILGGFSGKVGPVVGAKWKAIDYMRGYVIPANPQSVAQTAQRAKMTAMVHLARQILSSILQPFWDPFYNTMSGFNKFISLNIVDLAASDKLKVTSILSKGTLEPTTSVTGSYDTADGAFTADWDTTLVGNALATDLAVVVMYDVTGDRFFEYVTTTARSVGTFTDTIIAGLTATNVYCFVFFQRGTGPDLIVSNSLGDVCAAV